MRKFLEKPSQTGKNLVSRQSCYCGRFWYKFERRETPIQPCLVSAQKLRVLLSFAGNKDDAVGQTCNVNFQNLGLSCGMKTSALQQAEMAVQTAAAWVVAKFLLSLNMTKISAKHYTGMY